MFPEPFPHTGQRAKQGLGRGAFSFLDKKFSLWTVDGQIGLAESLTERGYAHAPGATGRVQNLVRNGVRNPA